jgi:hypothetical protein
MQGLTLLSMRSEQNGSLYRNPNYADKEKHMEIIQKIIIAVAVILVVGGLIWFFFIAH